jgi:RND superfamily putative drug exporter
VLSLTGRATWWAPGPLRRLHARFGIREGGPAPAAPAASDTPDASTPSPAADTPAPVTQERERAGAAAGKHSG